MFTAGKWEKMGKYLMLSFRYAQVHNDIGYLLFG